MTLRRILLTRPTSEVDRLGERLRAIGFEPVSVPAVVIAPPESFDALDASLRNLARYHWVVFTSANGVRVFFDRMEATGVTPAALTAIRWCAIGPATAEALSARGITIVWTPSQYLSEVVGDELPIHSNARVLRVRAAAASEVLTTRLRERGAIVDEVVAYQTAEAPAESVGPLADAFRVGVDAVIFTSASTVRGFARLAAMAHVDSRVPSLEIIAIGPVTAQAVAEQGWPVHLVAAEHSADGIVRLLAERSETGAAGHSRG